MATAVIAAGALVLSLGARGDELLEGRAVRNRLYQVAGRLELSPSVGFTFVNRLTQHFNLQAGVAYNFAETLGVELRAGYAFSGHTGLADQIAQHFLVKDLSSVDDLSSLWEMKGSAILGIRWAPIYGKISLVADLPIHFQTYLWAGGGFGVFHRQSVVYCNQGTGIGTESAVCSSWLTEDKSLPIGTAALGFRFYTHQSGSLFLEIRDYLFRDSYLMAIDRRVASSNERTGTPAGSPGAINLAFLTFGYAFVL